VDTPPNARRSAAVLGRAGFVVTAANAAANLLAYLVPVLGARRLAPADLGALATALALVAIATMPGIGLQTAVAVAVARSGGGAAASRGADRLAWITAVSCGGAVLLATPLLAEVLRLPMAVPPLLAAMTVPAVLAGWPLGVLQGSERFGRLACGTVLLAGGRYAGVLAALAAGTGLTGAVALGALVAWTVPPALWWLMRPAGSPAQSPDDAALVAYSPGDAALAVGSPDAVVPASGSPDVAAPAANSADAGAPVALSAADAMPAQRSPEDVGPAAPSLGAAPATHSPDGAVSGTRSSDGAVSGLLSPVAAAPTAPTPASAPPAPPSPGTSGPAAEAPADGVRGRAVFAAASASLAILVASYADLILARRLLPPGESGAYAVGAVLTRAAIWAPQVVTIVALPRLARGRGASLRVGLALVGAAGVLLVAAALVAGDEVVRAVGGLRYAALGRLAPYFILVGALYAITVFLLNAQLAAGARWPSAGVWAVVAGLPVLVAVVGPGTVAQLLACAVGAAAASVLTTGAAVWWRRSRREAPALTSAR